MILQKSRRRRYTALEGADLVNEISEWIEAELLRLEARRRRERRAVDRSRLKRAEDDVGGADIDDAQVFTPVQAVSFQYDLEQPVVGATGGGAADLRALEVADRAEALFNVEFERRLVVENHRDLQRRAGQHRPQRGAARAPRRSKKSRRKSKKTRQTSRIRVPTFSLRTL